MSEAQAQKHGRRRKKVTAQIVSTGNVFGETESASVNVLDAAGSTETPDETEALQRDPRAFAIAAAVERAEQQRTAVQNAVLAEDSTAYEYDSVYEEVSVFCARPAIGSVREARPRQRGCCHEEGCQRHSAF